MPKIKFVVAGFIVLELISLKAQAQIVDYPTLDRVLFVDECVRTQPQRHRQEMLYKCSCVLDKAAEEISFPHYIELMTSANAYSIAGERGSAVRSERVMDQVKEFKSAMTKAGNFCLMPN
jgi:hypothetical protein